MNDPKRAADRVRPFLQAMEQSINAARRRRLNGTDDEAEPTPPVDAAAEPQEVPRLRARPKRPSSPVFGHDGQEYRSKAG
jgi:hypothetical protein